MSKKFHVVNKHTGEKWKPVNGSNQYIVVTQKGFPLIVDTDFYTSLSPLPKADWLVVWEGEE